MSVRFIPAENFPITHLNIGTLVRLVRLNEYSTATELIKYFKLEDKCDPTSDDLTKFGIPYRLERIHKFWQLTPYVIRNFAVFESGNDEVHFVYHIESLDEKSNLIVSAGDVEKIEEYHSSWSIEE